MSGVAWTHQPYRLAGLVCFLVGVLVYINTLKCGFCFDDKAALLENKDILPTSSWSSLWTNDFWGTPLHLNTSHKSYRPLCVATFRLNYLLHELQPMGYHLVNILLHGAVCYLYVQLCGLVFSQVWPALIAGLLFAVHPIHTEAVAGIVGRADLMAALFFSLSLLAYHKAVVECGNTTGFTHHGYLVISLMLSLCSVLSKETGLTVIGVCIVYDLFLLQQNTFLALLNLLGQLIIPQFHKPRSLPLWFRWFLWRLLAITTFTGGVLGIRLWMMVTPPVFNKMDNEALSLDFPYRQLHWAHMTFVNSHLLLNPSRLLHDYRMNAIPLITSLIDTRNIVTLVTISVYILLGLYSLINFDVHRCASVHPKNSNGYTVSKGHSAVFSNINRLASYHSNGVTLPSSYNHQKWRYKSTQILLFGLTLIVTPYLPASNLFFPVGFVVAERVLYIPSMGVCLLIGYGAYRIFTFKSSRLVSGLCLVLVAGLLLTNAAKTFTRNKDWSSKVTLYGSLLQQYPSNGHILANVAREYRNIDKYEKAELAYRMGMRLAPNISINFINLGSMLKNQQKLKASEEVLFETIDMLKRTLDHDPENVGKLAMVYVSVSGIVARDASRLDEALELVEEALKLNSSLPGAHNSRGSFLLRKGLLPESLDEFQQAIHLQPSSTSAYYNMALVYRQKGEIERALSSLQKLLTIDSSHALAKAAIGTLKQTI